MPKVSTLPNGLTIIVDEMPHVKSVAYELVVPGGVILDEESRIGESLVLAELIGRGAGNYDSKALSDAFEEKGMLHGESALNDRFILRGQLLPENIDRALELLSLMVLEPKLPEDEIDDIRSLLLQDIASLSDSPGRLASVETAKRYFPAPYNRPGCGEEAGLNAVNGDSIREVWSRCFRPKGAVISFAGDVTLAQIEKMVGRYFGKWSGEGRSLPAFAGQKDRFNHHCQHESAQTQIVIAMPSAPFGHPHFYAAKVASVILSGGMFGRLFIEVREKRGLCYSVFYRHAGVKQYGLATLYAGTTPERSHETIQVSMDELNRLVGTVSNLELERARANVKSSLIIGEESSSGRASSNASDWWLCGRVRGLDEILRGINSVTGEHIDLLFSEYPPDNYSIVTLGDRSKMAN